MSEHARLAPSASKRLVFCPGSVNLSAAMPQTESSIWAAQGTAAHLLLDRCMLLDEEPHIHMGMVIRVENRAFTVDEDMADAVAHAIDYVRGYLARYPAAVLSTERRVYPGRAFKRKDSWGTLDLSLENLPVEIVVLDYKHGANIYVDVVENEQLKTYALGLLWDLKEQGLALGSMYNLPVRLVIIQPRSRGDGPVREFVTTVGEIIKWRDTLAAAAKESDRPNARLQAGDHCRFCAARSRCPEYAAYTLRLAQEEFTDEAGNRLIDVGSDRFSELLRAAPLLRAAADAWEAEAQRHLELGLIVPGFKLVRGRGSRSYHSDTAASAALVSAGYAEDVIAPRKLISPHQAEELLKTFGVRKKTRDALIGPLVQYHHGNPTLALESDPRPAVGVSAEFNDETENPLD